MQNSIVIRYTSQPLIESISKILSILFFFLNLLKILFFDKYKIIYIEICKVLEF